MTCRKLLLLLGFTEDDTKMASVRWRRFKKYLPGEKFSLEWVPVRLPFCDNSADAASKALCEVKVLHHARGLSARLARSLDPGVRTTVLASIPTLDPLYVGAMLRRMAGPNTELVLEIRDVYARPEFFEYNSVKRRLEIFKEAMLVRYVDRFIYLTDEIKRRYGTYYPKLQSAREGVVITNAYDPEEYGPRGRSEARPSLLEIGYFGSFYASRNPELLFQTLSLLKRKDPVGSALVRLHLWGELGGYPLKDKVCEYCLQGMVVYHGIAAHDSIIKEYPSTGVNLIITHQTGSSYALPGKLFEYIGAARPVWAITDDQILRDFMTRHNLGYLSSHDIGSVEATLRAILGDHRSAGRLPDINQPANFEIASLTRQLEEFLMNGAGG